MRTFFYVAKDIASGVSKSGVIEAPDERSAAITLRQHSLFPISIKLKVDNPVARFFSVFIGKVTQADLVNFTRQLATMVTAGLTLPDALSILQKQTNSGQFQRVLADVRRDIEAGYSLASSLGRYSDIFGKIYIELVRAGESAGALDNILNRLANNLERDKEFRSKTKGALIYPGIVFTAMMGVIILMMVFVMPKLTELYAQFDNAALPLPTAILIRISEITRKFWWAVILILMSIPILVSRYTRTPIGKKQFDRLILAVPIWGKLKKNIILAEFTRTLGLLVGAGIPILDALKIVAEAVDNAVFEKAILESAKQVERGSTLGVPLSQQKIFPLVISQMVRTGEETGKLDEVLAKVSTYFESESEHAVKNLTTALEPIILIILAVGVAFLIIAIILPIYNLTSQFQM